MYFWIATMALLRVILNTNKTFYVKWCIEDIVYHDVGYKIGLIKKNILADTDYIVLMAPSLKGLQKLIYILGESIKNCIPKANVKKPEYIVYK